MRITRQSGTELVVEDSSIWISALLFAASLPLFYKGIGSGHWPNIAVGGFFLLCSLVFLRKSIFIFDASEGTVRWTVRWLMRVAKGSLPLSEIKGIGVEASSGASSGGSSYRLTILTANAPIPFSASYSGNLKGYESIKSELERFLKLDPGSAPAMVATTAGGATIDEASVRSLLKQGRKIDAIALVRSSSKMNLTEAVEFVETIEQRMKAAE